MSVIVKDMRFPNYCSNCEFSVPWGNSGTYCLRYPGNDEVKYGEGKPDWCPLRDVPTPHGKLIDADALKAWFVEWYDLNADLEIIHFLEILSDEDSAPAIIEAEE